MGWRWRSSGMTWGWMSPATVDTSSGTADVLTRYAEGKDTHLPSGRISKPFFAFGCAEKARYTRRFSLFPAVLEQCSSMLHV